jgi:acyl dehydratase
MSTAFSSANELRDAVGRQFGPTDWAPIEQTQVDLFACATGDDQWIHVDIERAKSGPFGGTIAHGYLTLALVNFFLPQMIQVSGMKMGVNYGCDRVRFPCALRTGSQIRAVAQILETCDVEGGIQVKTRVTIEIHGTAKPACVADTLSRYYF